MKFLLDTHALIWAILAPDKLSATVKEVLDTHGVQVSVVSYWELVLKKNRQATPIKDPLAWWDRHVTRAAVEVMPVRVAHVDRLNALEPWHADPFDRMLVAQALAENCTLISRDPVLASYGVSVVWS